jgi:hypothetical protein
MRSTHALVFLLVFLAACATFAPRTRDPDLAPSATPAAAAAPAPEIARTYRSAPSICFDGALKLCRDRDWRIVNQSPSSVLSGHAASFDFTLTFARTPDNRTRVTIRRTPVDRDEATRLLDQLCDTLLEPRP